MSLTDIAKTGDYRKTLEALRDRLADEIETSTDARSVAQLSKQLMDVLSELNAEAAPDADSPAERIRRASEARKAAQESTDE